MQRELSGAKKVVFHPSRSIFGISPAVTSDDFPTPDGPITIVSGLSLTI
jgi:hypothetical protein